MAKPEKPKKSRSNVVTMPPEPAGNVAVAEPEPEITPETAPETPETRPVVATPSVDAPKPRRPSFFQRAQLIPKADWGTRAFIYVYCLEPICNLKMGGESKYLVRLSEPIADEQALMVDYGSGKYRLQMVNRKAGHDKSDALDTVEIEIYNPKYPPKIPRAVWMNDPRNERWAALLPKETPPAPPTGLGTVTDAFKTFTEIRRDLRDELTPAPQVAAGPPVDPMANALQMVQTIMSMKADNPMVEIMKEQLRASNDQAEKAREREATLQKELRDSMRALVATPATSQKNGIGQLKELFSEVKEFLPSIKEMLPQLGETVRAGRTTWLDIVREAAPTLVEASKQVVVALAMRTQTNGAYPPQLTPQGLLAPNGQPQQPNPGQQQLSSDQRLMIFLSQSAVLSTFRNYFQGACQPQPTNSGGDFAQWVYDGPGEEPLKDARGMGRDRIIGLFRQHPAWPALAPQEAQLTEFVDQILAWQPAPEEPDDDEEEGVDLTTQGV